MATEEDNFDIDIYGDGGEDFSQEAYPPVGQGSQIQQFDGPADKPLDHHHNHNSGHKPSDSMIEATEEFEDSEKGSLGTVIRKIDSTDPPVSKSVQPPKQVPQVQGIKRKEGQIDERDVDVGATAALYVSDLHWWITDDDIRGWANQSRCEDELEDISFNEHKVNGKSKGQAYVLFKSSQASTAVKRHVETFGEGQHHAKKFVVNFSNPASNPFRTLAKDGPARSTVHTNSSRPGGVSNSNYVPGYRGRGSTFSNRGAGGVHPNYGRGQYQGNFQAHNMNNFSPMGSMPQNVGFQARGGMMNTMRGSGMNFRGHRGGVMGMPMNMGMGSMGIGAGMQSMRGMGLGGNFNPGFFAQQGNPGYGNDTQHPAKRSRQD